MTISLFHQPTTDDELILIPLLSNSGHLSLALEKIASAYHLSAPLLQRNFKAEAGETHLVYTSKQCLVLLGMGEKPSFKDLLKAFRSFSHKHRENISNKLAVNFLFQNLPSNLSQWIEAMTNGLLLGSYQIGRYQTNKQVAA